MRNVKSRPRKIDTHEYARTARAHDRRQREQRAEQRRREDARTAASAVTVTRADGSVEVQAAYSSRELAVLAPERVPVPRALRDAVYRRDGRACRYCGARDDLTLDHVVPVVRGGLSNMTNLVTACRPCNSRKGASVWPVPPLP